MFVGHFGVGLISFALFFQNESLWANLLACQIMDVVFGILALLDIEQFRMVPKRVPQMVLDFVPYSHSLVSSLLMSIVCAILGFLFGLGSLGIAFNVFAHWVVDFICHEPDLPLLPFQRNPPQFGLSFWHYKNLSFAVEISLVILGVILALPSIGGFCLGFFLVFMQTASTYGPAVPTPKQICVMGFFVYSIVPIASVFLV